VPDLQVVNISCGKNGERVPQQGHRDGFAVQIQYDFEGQIDYQFQIRQRVRPWVKARSSVRGRVRLLVLVRVAEV
jgi:hypothetical protein